MVYEVNKSRLRKITTQKIIKTLFILTMSVFFSSAYGRQVSLISFDNKSGLTDLDVSYISEGPGGYVFVGTEHGVFYFDGTRFQNLGKEQGLPEGGYVNTILYDRNKNVIIVYSEDIFISDRPVSAKISPDDLKFKRILSTSDRSDLSRNSSVAVSNDVLFFLEKNTLSSINIRTGKFIKSKTHTNTESDYFRENMISRVYNDPGGKVFFARLQGGQMCKIHPKLSSSQGDFEVDLTGQCVSDAKGNALSWTSAVFAPDGTVWLRDAARVMHVSFDNDIEEIYDLPASDDDQKRGLLSFAISENGRLIVPTGKGLVYGLPDHWERLDAISGLPSSTVVTVASGHSGTIWLGTWGGGLVYIHGLDEWDNWNRRDGLRSDEIWDVLATSDAVWFASYAGLYSFNSGYGTIKLNKYYEYRASLVRNCKKNTVIALTVDNKLLSIKDGNASSSILKDGQAWSMECSDDDKVWIGSGGGLYYTNLKGEEKERHSILGVSRNVYSLFPSENGDLWFIEGKELHIYRHGRDNMVVGRWPDQNFDPRTIMADSNSSIWVGGSAGPLYHVYIDENCHVERMYSVNTPTIISNTVVALQKDKRGWLWVGTDQGVSVYNGTRWTGVTTEDGLIWNDIVQDAISVAPDDTIWFGTSHGASHLLHPERIFDRPPLTLAIISARLGSAPLAGYHTHNRLPVEVVFGTLNVANFNSMHFRYRMDGVDQGWVDTTERVARYPELPPGAHTFHVYAYNPITHQQSSPIEIAATMQAPWWEWVWVDLLAAGTLALLVYGGVRLRIRQLLRREHELELVVAERTRAIKAAQEALVIQATMDGLTQTFNRSAIQDLLDRALRRDSIDDENGLTIGLLDVDHFKRINDLAGHLAGDEVLREFGARLRAHMLPEEYIGRYGGEEFLILLHGNPDHGRSRLSRLKSLATGRAFQFNNEAMRVTCSIGVAHARTGDTWQSLVSRADACLYAAKQEGRDRIVDAERDLESGAVSMRRARRRYRDLTE